MYLVTTVQPPYCWQIPKFQLIGGYETLLYIVSINKVSVSPKKVLYNYPVFIFLSNPGHPSRLQHQSRKGQVEQGKESHLETPTRQESKRQQSWSKCISNHYTNLQSTYSDLWISRESSAASKKMVSIASSWRKPTLTNKNISAIENSMKISMVTWPFWAALSNKEGAYPIWGRAD